MVLFTDIIIKNHANQDAKTVCQTCVVQQKTSPKLQTSKGTNKQNGRADKRTEFVDVVQTKMIPVPHFFQINGISLTTGLGSVHV